MARFAALAFLLSALPAFAQDLIVKSDDVKVVKVTRTIVIEEDREVVGLPFTVEAPKGAAFYAWILPPGVTFVDKGFEIEVATAPAGCLNVGVKIVTVESKITDREKLTIETKAVTTFVSRKVHVAGDAKPPSPPVPPPPPAPSPITSEDGPRVLVLYEKTKPDKDGVALLTRAQKLELNSKAFADYLNAKCVKDGGQPAWRRWDVNVQGLENAPAWYRQAMALPRTDDRWLIVADKTRGVSEPLPAGGKILERIREILGP